MSRSDPIPAPMVQIPADKVEALRQQTLGWTGVKGFPLLTAARAVVDAASPAASVPAADILALADNLDEWASSWLITEVVEKSRRELAADILTKASAGVRALVAAAEQADKGEAADTPRDEDLFDDLRGHPDDTPMSGEAAIQYAPAAPPEPLCRCGHGKSEHAQGSFSCGHVIEGSGCELHVCSCSVFRYGSPARVPVNDEAEAAYEDWRELTQKTLTHPDCWEASRIGFIAGFRAARGEDA